MMLAEMSLLMVPRIMLTRVASARCGREYRCYCTPGNGATQSSDVSSANKVAPSTFVDPNTIRDVEAQPQMAPEVAHAAGMFEDIDGPLESLDDKCSPSNGATQSTDVSSANKVAS